MTHKIDANIDESAIYVLADLVAKERLTDFGTVGGIPKSSSDKPAINFSNAPYYTSGNRLVAVLSESRHPAFPNRFNWNVYAYDLPKTQSA